MVSRPLFKEVSLSSRTLVLDRLGGFRQAKWRLSQHCNYTVKMVKNPAAALVSNSKCLVLIFTLMFSGLDNVLISVHAVLTATVVNPSLVSPQTVQATLKKTAQSSSLSITHVTQRIAETAFFTA